jgi:hypothetical protein
VHAPELSLLATGSTTSMAVAGSGCLFAYGSVPGVELIPYFLALLAWVGMALAAIFLSPFTALIRRLRKTKNPQSPSPQTEVEKSTNTESHVPKNSTEF